MSPRPDSRPPFDSTWFIDTYGDPTEFLTSAPPLDPAVPSPPTWDPPERPDRPERRSIRERLENRWNTRVAAAGTSFSDTPATSDTSVPDGADGKDPEPTKLRRPSLKAVLLTVAAAIVINPFLAAGVAASVYAYKHRAVITPAVRVGVEGAKAALLSRNSSPEQRLKRLDRSLRVTRAKITVLGAVKLGREAAGFASAYSRQFVTGKAAAMKSRLSRHSPKHARRVASSAVSVRVRRFGLALAAGATLAFSLVGISSPPAGTSPTSSMSDGKDKANANEARLAPPPLVVPETPTQAPAIDTPPSQSPYVDERAAAWVAERGGATTLAIGLAAETNRALQADGKGQISPKHVSAIHDAVKDFASGNVVEANEALRQLLRAVPKGEAGHTPRTNQMLEATAQGAYAAAFTTPDKADNVTAASNLVWAVDLDRGTAEVSGQIKKVEAGKMLPSEAGVGL